MSFLCTVLCRNPRKAPLSSFPANDYTPSSVTWAVDSRILLRLVLRSPRSTVKAYSPAVATAIATCGTHKLQQMPSRTNSKGNTNQNGFCAVPSGQISGQINSPCVCGIKGGVAQLTKALSNDWAGDEITENSIFYP